MDSVKDFIQRLISNRPGIGFLKNTVQLTCSTCGYFETFSYYALLNEPFEVLEPTAVPDTFIRESMYEEDITATPIKFIKNCPKCSGQLQAYSPVPLEYLINILQSTPPDDIMYG